MNFFLLVLGILLVMVVWYDLIQTALRLGQRGGPLTVHLASYLWRAALHVPRLVALAGVTILLGIVFTWLLFSWVGWSLIFSSGIGSVVDATTKEPVDLLGKIYFAGYTIVTLGNGDLEPVGWWRIATVLASGSGFMIVTLSISYLVPLLSAVVEKRALAGRVRMLGESIEETVGMLTRPGVDEMRAELTTFPRELLLLKERHLAYPVLHYFQTRDRDAAIAPNLAVLVEALLVVVEGVEEPDPEMAAAAEKVVHTAHRLVDSLESWFVSDPPQAPPPPPLDILLGTGVKPRSQDEYERRVATHARLRRHLRWMVQDTGWSWDDDVVRSAPAMDERSSQHV